MKRKILLFLIFILSIDLMFAQCAMCKASLEAGIKSGGIEAGGINNGILYLMFIPYLLIVAVGFFMYKHFKS